MIWKFCRFMLYKTQVSTPSELKPKLSPLCTRIKWLYLGDFNTSYFHHLTSSRNAANSIKFLIREDGSHTFDLKAIHEMATNHYSSLLRPDHAPQSSQLLSWLEVLIPFRCSHDFKNYSPEQITSSLFRMPTNRIPRIDGFTSEFFKHNWMQWSGSSLLPWCLIP